MSNARQIVLVGLSGVGKSSVGRALTEALGWPLIDTDDLVTEREGRTPAQLIVESGEDAFRQVEERVVVEAARQAPAVIATGGGSILSARSRRALGEHGFLCYLDATPYEIARRLRQAPQASERPLLEGDIEARLAQLDAERRPFYNHADAWIPVQALSPKQTAVRVLEAWSARSADTMRDGRRIDRLGTDAPARGPAALVDTGEERYPIWVGAGELQRLPDRLRMLDLGGRVFVVSDAEVIAAHGERVAQVLDGAGFAGASYLVPSGERSKQLSVAAELYRWLTEQHAERSDTVLALGGGVVGDLAGFVAATYLRGIPLVQVPTSVLAMTDASIGGKVAVDLPQGKNLVGAFHQPRGVIADVDTLSTLPRRALLEGYAEVIKHALILDPGLLLELESRTSELAGGTADPGLIASIIGRSARLKALVVSTDPRESGLRAILNYGHTLGHGIEVAGGYERYLHGEAVAIGMVGAARIAERLGMLDAEHAHRQMELLHSFGLPIAADGIDPDAVLAAMRLDKKVKAGRQRLVLLEEPGRAVVRDDVPVELVEDVVRGLVAGGAV